MPFKHRVDDQLTLDPLEERYLAQDRRRRKHWRGEDSVERDAAVGLKELESFASDSKTEDPIAKQAIRLLGERTGGDSPPSTAPPPPPSYLARRSSPYPAPSAPQPAPPAYAAPQPSFSSAWDAGAWQPSPATSWGGRYGEAEGLPQVGDPLPDAIGVV